MKKVLIADDDVDLLDMVKMLLSRAGFAISTIASGKFFLERVTTVKPDIILLDVFLGDTDGRSLCQLVKTDPEYHDIPVILYSAGYISTSSISHSRANAFFSKPFDIKELVEKIKALVK
jgi:DNA-binding response OmpR family regulator